jgi:23S rRNA (pseudouridine1915-N3)-methyltransferase
MKLQLVVVGRMKEGFGYLQTGIDDYLKRLKAFAPVSIIEVPDEPIRPSKTAEQIMAAEAERLRPYIERASYAIALWEKGDKLSSEKFSQTFFERIGGDPSNGGISTGASGTILFIVGGALGLHPSIIERCHWTVSLSPMTFPHPMVRLIVLEQLYRAFKISRGEPYHK